MKEIEFYKMSGSGNDFILIDNRNTVFPFEDPARVARRICQRAISIGADGMILIEEAEDEDIDFRWRFYNADGSDATMCGNAARCAARMSYLLGISGRKISFLTGAGVIHAEIMDDGRVKVKMNAPTDIARGKSLSLDGEIIEYDFADTGVPHAVVYVGSVDELNALSVEEIGRKMRYHKDFTPEGANANFTAMDEMGEDNILYIRTYERGVEGETLACGTGAVASAILMYIKGRVRPPVLLLPKSGITLNVDFIDEDDGFKDVYLEGDARMIYRGKFSLEALD